MGPLVAPNPAPGRLENGGVYVQRGAMQCGTGARSGPYERGERGERVSNSMVMRGLGSGSLLPDHTPGSVCSGDRPSQAKPESDPSFVAPLLPRGSCPPVPAPSGRGASSIGVPSHVGSRPTSVAIDTPASGLEPSRGPRGRFDSPKRPAETCEGGDRGRRWVDTAMSVDPVGVCPSSAPS